MAMTKQVMDVRALSMKKSTVSIRRDYVLKIRLSDEERVILEDRRMMLPMAEYVRQSLMQNKDTSQFRIKFAILTTLSSLYLKFVEEGVDQEKLNSLINILSNFEYLIDKKL